MGLNFKNREMGFAIISLLKNVYYYTGRWRLSVASFTGKNKDYWEKLPSLLRAAKGNPHRIDKIINELQKLANEAELREEKRRALVRQNLFQDMEVVMNEQLLIILSALPHDLLAKCFGELLTEKVFPGPARLVERDLGTKEQLIEPDILIMANRHLLMVELKVKGVSSKADTKYDANQLCNYFSLAVKCEKENDGSLPNNYSHLILVPSIDYRWFIKGEKWITELQTGADKHIAIDPQKCFEIANKDKRQKYITNVDELNELLKRVPIYCRTFNDLAEAFGKAAYGYPLGEHWLRIQKELEELASVASAGIKNI
jgi:hypothetical protein